ncbi:MAG: response regulator transcription factor [Armatimonadetes bacterium]|nr:response regulator transcription factor [Armatimonadota bacterium]MBS1710259.1 response regulator transcription factor [Armatimonadota bacterium]MBX3109104.1 response regulator transcription factor [Fimbriimonadaceae bacterium]
MRILIVEDDLVIASELERALRKAGNTPDVARDGETALRLVGENAYAAIVLDIMIPAPSGLEVCRAIRAGGNPTPILMLTAKDAIEDRVAGLDAGADDYLVKPFAFQELTARLRAITRRDTQLKGKLIEIADLTIDPLHHTASRAGQDLNLTKREFTLLEALARRSGQVLTRDAILERVWNNLDTLPNTVNFHVSSLRKKVDPPGAPALIHTVHGVGYVLRPPD